MVRDSIFLSGWEYNRVLSENPFLPRNSGLPAEVLWNGAAPFWLFRKVYCTKEAFDIEKTCDERLQWATGWIFQKLKREGLIEPVDLAKMAREDDSFAAKMTT